MKETTRGPVLRGPRIDAIHFRLADSLANKPLTCRCKRTKRNELSFGRYGITVNPRMKLLVTSRASLPPPPKSASRILILQQTKYKTPVLLHIPTRVLLPLDKATSYSDWWRLVPPASSSENRNNCSENSTRFCVKFNRCPAIRSGP